jgi:hypothetical protein
MNGRASLERPDAISRYGLESRLAGSRGLDRMKHSRKGGADKIADALEYDSFIRFNGLAQDSVVVRESRLRHTMIALPEPCAGGEICEQERDCAGRKRASDRACQLGNDDR